MPRDCPVCGLVNPDTAPACDCGYSFACAGSVGRVQLGAAARRNMLIGGFVCFAGLSLALLGIAASKVIVLALVAIFFGAVQFVRGVIQERRSAIEEGSAQPSDAPAGKASRTDITDKDRNNFGF